MPTQTTSKKKAKKSESVTRKSVSALVECNKLIALQNSHINKRKVLSSGRELPSKLLWQHLETLCEVSYSALSVAQLTLAKYEDVLVKKLKRIEEKYKREQSKLLNDGDYWATKQQLKKMRQNVKATQEHHDQQKQLYKRSTSYDWKPKADVNKPL